MSRRAGRLPKQRPIAGLFWQTSPSQSPTVKCLYCGFSTRLHTLKAFVTFETHVHDDDPDAHYRYAMGTGNRKRRTTP
jgi:hypothetical protein